MVGAAVGFVFLLTALSTQVFGANSDGATVVLEGQSMSAGHLLLKGWDLSLDSFWSIDALFYTVGVALFGVHRELLHLVPAVIAAGVLLVGSLLALDGRRGWAALVGPLAVVVLLGLGSPDLSFFMLQGPWHIGTALWSLVAFAALTYGPMRRGWPIAVVFLAAGLLGDLQALALGVVPVFLAGLVAMARRRSLRAGLDLATAAPAAVVLALVVHLVARAIGSFSIAASVTDAKASRFTLNFGHAFTWGAGLLGVRHVAIGPAPQLTVDDLTNGTLLERMAHLPGLILVAAALLLALFGLLRGLARGTEPGGGERAGRLEDLLVLATLGSIAMFVALCPNNNGDYARYLTAGVIFSGVLGARLLGRLVAGARSRTLTSVALVLFALTAVASSWEVGSELSSPAAVQPAAALGPFLLAHGLRVGVGDYWSSSIVTVDTADAVQVRPVISVLGGRLVRYDRQSDASWYGPTRFDFLVYDTHRPWRDVNATTATATFGAPSRSYAVGTYVILVWDHPFTVSTVGFTRG